MINMTIGSKFAISAVLVSAIGASTWGHRQDRSYTGGHFAMGLNGSFAGFLNSVKGGMLKGQNITLECSPSAMGKEIQQWIKKSFNGNERRSGSIVAADFDYKAKAYREFQDALITEITFPKFDASDKDPAYMTIKIQPESVRNREGDGAKVAKPDSRSQKSWLPCNFRLEIEGLDCKYVSSIEFPNLLARIPKRGSNVTLVIPEEAAQKWPVKWEGPDLDASKNDFKPRDGRITLLDERGRSLMAIDFRMVKIVQVRKARGGKSLSMELLFDSFRM
jgi:hypothetical protein